MLGFDSVPEYVKDSPYFGATCGRVANRIAKGEFSLEGKDYQLATNNGPNHLHGGTKGWSHHRWEASTAETSEGPSVIFTRESPDGEEGYPGTVKIKALTIPSVFNELPPHSPFIIRRTTSLCFVSIPVYIHAHE